MMTPADHDRQAEATARKLPPGRRVGVIGSASFRGRDSREICVAVGSQLAKLSDLVLLTGGIRGVGKAVGRSFFAARRRAGLPRIVYHILPRPFGGGSQGGTLFAGSSMVGRREILGRLARVYVSIEGGPGTAHEARVAQAASAAVVPIGRTGGFSGDLYDQICCPAPEAELEWRILGDAGASAERIGIATRRIVDALSRPDGPPR